jgi:SAM-dependent methyltransferase
VSRVFEPWGRLMVDTLGVGPGDRVLDVATGTGVVARLASEASGSNGRVVGADLSASMLAVASSTAAPENGAPIQFIRCRAEQLGVATGGFDVATCQQGVQFFAERAAAVAELRRALRPGGRVGIAVWGSIEDSPPFSALASAIEQVLGAEPARRYRDGPWGFGTPDRLHRLLATAGFSNVRVERRSLPVRFEGGPRQVAETLATGPTAADVAALDRPRRGELDAAIAASLAPMTRDGAVVSQLSANLAVAVA